MFACALLLSMIFTQRAHAAVLAGLAIAHALLHLHMHVMLQSHTAHQSLMTPVCLLLSPALSVDAFTAALTMFLRQRGVLQAGPGPQAGAMMMMAQQGMAGLSMMS
jgi:hypothetical protein